MNPDIILVSINARYSHAALGPRCLLANMGDLRSRTDLEEFVIQDPPRRIVERLILRQPKIIGISLAIWNITVASQVMQLLKILAPEILLITGGPEVRWAEAVPENADYLVRGEGEIVFPRLCRDILETETRTPPSGTVMEGGLPNLDSIRLPFDEYSDTDLRQRIISVETSRGCPFGCEFCLSSREETVRKFNLDTLLPAFDKLLERGCRGFKFIDRTFNLENSSPARILDFFYERWPRDENGTLISPRNSRQVGQGSNRGESLFLHFEVIPDRFEDALIESLARFPDGGIQLEMGIQTLDPVVGKRISRRVNRETASRNIRLLREKTGVHIHADLIMGLPGEDSDGIAESFDSLRRMNPHEIQMGILKLLPGAPIVRHSDRFAMVYNPDPPYEVLKTSCIGFPEMQDLKRLARYYDVFANSGKFTGAMRVLMDRTPSAFTSFMAFARWIWNTTGQEHAIAQAKQYGLVLNYLSSIGMDREAAGRLLAEDYLRVASERYLPEVLRQYHKS